MSDQQEKFVPGNSDGIYEIFCAIQPSGDAGLSREKVEAAFYEFEKLAPDELGEAGQNSKSAFIVQHLTEMKRQRLEVLANSPKDR